MATFKYTAKDMDAKKITGKMEANDRKELAAFLRSDGKFLIECKDVTNIEKKHLYTKIEGIIRFLTSIRNDDRLWSKFNTCDFNLSAETKKS